uniref:N-acetylgalactosaminide beta-1,3-galactosyltransferase n=1 Tax=Strongyloides papillosus TaxID=174720 RepID=A0A0N5C556_STREA
METTNFIYIYLFIVCCQTIKSTDNVKHFDDTNIVSEFLFNKVKIFCLILTGPQYTTSRVKFQKETWLNRCNDYLYVSSLSNSSLPSIGADVVEGRDTLWEKIRFGLEYVYLHYFNKYDWFLLVDDDSFVFMENMRFFLLSQNSNATLHYGFRMKDLKFKNKEGYIQGGGGDVLSKVDLQILVNYGFQNDSLCGIGNGDSGDVELGKCLSNIGIKIGETRDFQSRLTFLPGTPDAFTGVDKNQIFNSFQKLSYYKINRGIESLSEYLISLHYLSGHNMYIIEYLMYHANVFGRQSSFYRNITRSRISDNMLKSLVYRKLKKNF